VTTMNRQIVLTARPEGLPKPSDFQLVEVPVPEPNNGQFLVKTNYLSVDPYMRGRISEAKSYAEPVQINEVMVGGTVGTVVESRHPGYQAGDVVVGYWGWQEYAVSDGQGVEKFDTSLAPMSTTLGVLGMPGMTAYFGLLEIGKPKQGETVFVSGSAGAVGSLVGQIAKIKGCRVVGSAGSQQKVDYVTRKGRLPRAPVQARGLRQVSRKGETSLCPRQNLFTRFGSAGSGPLSGRIRPRTATCTTSPSRGSTRTTAAGRTPAASVVTTCRWWLRLWTSHIPGSSNRTRNCPQLLPERFHEAS